MNPIVSRAAAAFTALAVVAWLAGCDPKPADPPKPSTRGDAPAPAEPRPVDLRVLT